MKKTFFLILLILAGSLLFAQQKHALIIGNAEYTGISKLNNPVNDANDMETVLKDMGFTVIKLLNGSRHDMEAAVMQLYDRLSRSRGSYGLFFYAGHGVQSGGENYLIPVDANIPSENALRDRAVSLNWVLAELNDAGNELNFVVLDSCRDNPFSWNRSGTRGLTTVTRSPPGSIIFYATSDGQPAADGVGRNGLFTGQLLNSLRTPGLEIMDVIRRTGAAVSQVSNGTQIPAVYNQFFGIAYLGVKPADPVVQEVVQPPAPVIQPAPVTQIDSSSALVRNAPEGFAYIPGGAFIMGSPANEAGRNSNEGPQRQVTISAFYAGKFQVTQKEYQDIMGTNPSNFKNDNQPVENVSWMEVIDYCNRRSRREGLTPAYTVSGTNVTWNRNANGYRLPTEAEWEYACRAGTVTAYNTGAAVSDNTGWYNSNSGGRPRAVGQKPANAWGLFDMHGNIAEWCWDWFANYTSAAQTDPAGAASGSYRITRGGSWGHAPAQFLRSASRNYELPFVRGFHLGFRVVRNLQ